MLIKRTRFCTFSASGSTTPIISHEKLSQFQRNEDFHYGAKEERMAKVQDPKTNVEPAKG